MEVPWLAAHWCPLVSIANPKLGNMFYKHLMNLFKQVFKVASSCVELSSKSELRHSRHLTLWCGVNVAFGEKKNCRQYPLSIALAENGTVVGMHMATPADLESHRSPGR